MSIDLPRTPIERVPTGVPGLDLILRGGLLRGGVYLARGTPGTGKTTLANQLCFHHVVLGGRAIYVTLLVESHSWLFAHLQSFTFFNHTVIGDGVQYFSGYDALATEGLPGLLQLLTQTLREQQPTILVIDGFDSVKSAAASDLALKQFLHDLHVYSEVTHSTILLLGQQVEAGPTPEDTMVDGILALQDTRVGQRRVRELEVLKLRGSAYLRGAHLFTITDTGLTIHPRVEAYLPTPLATEPLPRTHHPFGVPRLDEMLGGALLSGSSTLLLGPPGAGKTLLGMQFLATGAQQGEPSLYYGMYEPPAQLIARAEQMGWPFQDYLNRGVLELIWHLPREDVLDVYAERLLTAVHRRQVRRLFFDGLDGLRHVVHPERLPQFFAALLEELRALDVSTVFTLDMDRIVSPEIQLPISSVLSTTLDTMILLRHVELHSQLYRLLSILKSRSNAYDPAIREYTISGNGIDVAASFESAEAILTGVARPVPREVPPAPSRRRARKKRGQHDQDSDRGR